MILKRKFEHVGLGKIERGEWMLQDHHTGRILDLKKHWKAIAKVSMHPPISHQMVYSDKIHFLTSMLLSLVESSI